MRDKRLEFLQAVDESFEKAKSNFDALREDPTPDVQWAIWMDFMKKPAATHVQEKRRSDTAIGSEAETGD